MIEAVGIEFKTKTHTNLKIIIFEIHSYVTKLIFYFLFFRHVHLVMYIIYLWIEWILLGFVIQQGMHVVKKDLRFDITDHASNQVKPCVPKPKFHVQDVLTFIFFSSPILKPSCLSTLCLSRALYQPPVKPPPNIGMCPEVSLVLAQLQTS